MLYLRRLTKNSINGAPIFDAIARCFSSIQIPKPIATPITSSATYDDLINAAGRQRDFAAVGDLLTKRSRDGWFNTANTFKFISTDVSVLPDLLQNLATLNNWFTRKHAHDTVVAQLARLHRTPEALRVAETMVRNHYGATSATFHPILNGLTQKKKMKEAWCVVEMMLVCNVKPDLTAFNYILTAYCLLGELTSASDVLVKLEDEGLKADARTYDALVLGACKARKLEVALRVMRRMVEDGMPALYSTHAHVIKEMVRAGYFAQAVEFVKIFGGRNQILDAENIGFLVARLMNAKRVAEANFVVKEVEKSGLPITNELKSFCAKFHVEGERLKLL